MAILDTKFYKQTEEKPLAEEEKIISYYIYKNDGYEDYSELIKDDNRYFVKYNFSDYRTSALRWYPFKKDSSVLEINAEYGALTGALCDNCKNVSVTENSFFRCNLICSRYKNRDNLKVYAAAFEDIEFEQKFDYIIFFKTLEGVQNPVECLNSLKELLNPNGILLFEVENQYGIQYLAGQKESHSGIPFDSIANYPNKYLGHGFNKASLIHILEQSEFKAWKFYYPLADYVATTAIYTDEGKPRTNFIERFMLFHSETSTMIAWDRNLFIDAVANNVYTELSNHFIIEASDVNSFLSDIQSATISGYRSHAKAFATIIHNNGTVEKKGLYKDSLEYAKYLCNLVDKIAARGIPILPMKVRDYSIWMDFVKVDTVQLYITKLARAKQNRERIFFIIDKLWAYILKSSDFADVHITTEDGEDLGPILKDAYLEMVTINSFWVNDDILFFDQELIRANKPAKYILWRSFNMMYGQTMIEEVIPRVEMQNRYGILDSMDRYFLDLDIELSKQENPYHQFLPDTMQDEQLRNNRLKLLGGE